MMRVILGLGANLGDRGGNMQRAVDMLAEAGVLPNAVSSVYETPPMPADQPSYFNAVVTADTSLGPEELLMVVKRIEEHSGRRANRHWGPRPLDIDILFYGDAQIESPILTVPHPALAQRAFVLIPLAEVHPGALPVLGSRPVDLLEGVDCAGISRLAVSLRLPHQERSDDGRSHTQG